MTSNMVDFGYNAYYNLIFFFFPMEWNGVHNFLYKLVCF